jgi:hypothetical protein
MKRIFLTFIFIIGFSGCLLSQVRVGAGAVYAINFEDFGIHLNSEYKFHKRFGIQVFANFNLEEDIVKEFSVKVNESPWDVHIIPKYYPFKDFELYVGIGPSLYRERVTSIGSVFITEVENRFGIGGTGIIGFAYPATDWLVPFVEVGGTFKLTFSYSMINAGLRFEIWDKN